MLGRHSVVDGGELVEQTLGDEGGERDVVAVFLHLFLGFLRTLESEVLQSPQHPAPRVQSADQLVGGAQTDTECQVLGVLLRLLRGHITSWSLQPTNNLESPAGAELRVCNKPGHQLVDSQK